VAGVGGELAHRAINIGHCMWASVIERQATSSSLASCWRHGSSFRRLRTTVADWRESRP